MDHQDDNTPTERTILAAPRVTVTKEEFVETLPQLVDDSKIMGLAYDELEHIARAHDPILADKAAAIGAAFKDFVSYLETRVENRGNHETIFGDLLGK